MFGPEVDCGGPDAFRRACPSRRALELVSDKWAILLLGALGLGPTRFGALRRKIDGITQKMLTQTLRTLERNGMVRRTVFATTPPSVEYALTDLGHSALQLLEQLRVWAETHAGAVEAAQAAYDARGAPGEVGADAADG